MKNDKVFPIKNDETPNAAAKKSVFLMRSLLILKRFYAMRVIKPGWKTPSTIERKT
jgi:hypothetical protein